MGVNYWQLLLNQQKFNKMDNYSKLYWLTRLDGIVAFFSAIASISGIIGLLIGVYYVIVYDKDDMDSIIENKIKSAFKTCCFAFPISLLALVFVPTKNDMIIIYAGGKTMDYVKQDTSLQKIPAQTTKIISNYLDNAIKDLEKK